MLIGLVDSGTRGIDPDRIAAARAYYMTGRDVVREEAAHEDRLGHGSALARILLDSSAQARLLVGQVFHDRLGCNPALVAAAVDWLIDQRARVINMSFGLRSNRTALRKACRRALDYGVILVAASPARGDAVYPASYEGVIRATGDARCAPQEISHLDSCQADFGAYVRCPSDPRVAGASVGCAQVSAAVTRYLESHPNATLQQVREALIAQSRYHGPERKR